MKMNIATKFAPWEVPELVKLTDSRVYRLREKLNNGERLCREEKDWITENVNHNAYFKDAIPLMGYCFSFADILKTYIVKQNEYYQEYRAVDKTSLRSVLYGRIDKIIEIN